MYGAMPKLDEMAEAKKLADETIEENENFDLALTELGSYVQRCWNAAVNAKSEIEQEMIKCLRQRQGVYEPEVMSQIKEEGGSEIFMMISQVKCRATESWILDILFPPGEFPFGIEPTAKPEVDAETHARVQQEVMAQVQEAMMMGIEIDPEKVKKEMDESVSEVDEEIRRHAEKRSKRMLEVLKDVTQRGGWFEAMEDFVSDFVTYPAAFLKGPTRIRQKDLEWGTDEFGQVFPVVGNKIIRKYKRISPFDAFPAPDARDVEDGPFIERMRFRRKELYDLVGVPGYDDDEIRECLDTYGDSGHKLETQSDSQREDLTEQDQSSEEPLIEAINFWGQCRGQWLIDRGVPESLIPDVHDDYEANVIQVGRYTIRAAINPHPLGRRPYASASFECVPGTIWGRGIPQIIRDIQNMCNSVARALANNMALASGPIVEVQVDRLAQGENPGGLAPLRVYQTRGSRSGEGGSSRAINFWQADSNANQLLPVYTYFSSLADEYSGVPPYAHGANMSGGAASTATGLTMLQDNAARGIKRAIKFIDRVVKKSITLTFQDVMLYDDNPEIKGDVQIIAKGSTAMINREREAMHLNELLMSTANPMDMEIIQSDGRKKLLESAISARGLDPRDILPSDQEIEQAKQMMMMQQQMEQMPQATGQPDPREAQMSHLPKQSGDMVSQETGTPVQRG